MAAEETRIWPLWRRLLMTVSDADRLAEPRLAHAEPG